LKPGDPPYEFIMVDVTIKAIQKTKDFKVLQQQYWKYMISEEDLILERFADMPDQDALRAELRGKVLELFPHQEHLMRKYRYPEDVHLYPPYVPTYTIRELYSRLPEEKNTSNETSNTPTKEEVSATKPADTKTDSDSSADSKKDSDSSADSKKDSDSSADSKKDSDSSAEVPKNRQDVKVDKKEPKKLKKEPKKLKNEPKKLKKEPKKLEEEPVADDGVINENEIL